MGVELGEPVINDKCLAYSITSVGGVDGTSRFLENFTGVWLVRECRREGARAGGRCSYGGLTRQAVGAPALASLVLPGDMPAHIQGFCRDTAQTVPATKSKSMHGALVRCSFKVTTLESRASGAREEANVRYLALRQGGGVG